MDSRTVISRIKADGWFQVSHEGSHIRFRHRIKKGRATVPHPKKDLPVGTLRSIEKPAGIKLR